MPGDHAGSARAAPVEADHPDPARRRLRKESHQIDSEPRSETSGHYSGRTGKNAGSTDFLHGSERLPGVIRNLRGGPHALARLGIGQTYGQTGIQAGEP